MASAGVATGAGVEAPCLLPEPPHAFKVKIIHKVRNRTISFFMARTPFRYLFQPVFYHFKILFAREKSEIIAEIPAAEDGIRAAGIDI